MASAAEEEPRLVTEEEAKAAKINQYKENEYELVKFWDEASGTWLLRRKEDSQLFLGFRWEASQEFADMLQRGAGEAVAQVLNHANLVNVISTVPIKIFNGLVDEVAYYSVWDFCDAGSLGEFMRRTAGIAGVPRPMLTAEGRIKRFLPESLVWHVAISMLRALAWLHEGYREEACTEWKYGEPEQKARGWRADVKEGGTMNEDWMPILHRDIRADNIFFQHPRGSETYGYCKLGNFSKVFVSGHVQNRSGGHVVCSEDGEVPLYKLREHMAVHDIYTVKKNERPYFKGTELYRLGEVLYQMMTRERVPDREECNICSRQHHEPAENMLINDPSKECPYGKHFYISDELGIDENLYPVGDVPGYSGRLRLLVFDMLTQPYRGSGSMEVDGKNSIAFLQVARNGYKVWKTTDEDGKLYRDEFDDMLLREENKMKNEEADAASAKKQSAPDAVDILEE